MAPKRERDDDDLDFDGLEIDDYGDLSDEEIEELMDLMGDFPELDYLDELEYLADDDDFYGITG